MRNLATKFFIFAFAAFVAIAFSTPLSFADLTTSEVQGILQNVKGADAVRYDTKDNTGRNVETLDVAANPDAEPGQADRYIGVSHILEDGKFQVYLTQSSDLVNWTNVTKIKSNASNPAIVSLPTGGYLVALESHDNPGNHVQIRSYKTLTDLETGDVDEVYNGSRTLSNHAEGTPSFRSVEWRGNMENSTIHLGMHYYRNGDVDRQALATLDNGVWTEEVREGLNNLMYDSVSQLTATYENNTIGNFGSRREFQVSGRDYEIVEGQLTKNDWAAWRLFLYDVQDNQLVALDMDPHYGQTSFGNPTAHVLPSPDGNGQVLFWSSFLFSDGAPLGAGQMVAYKHLPVL